MKGAVKQSDREREILIGEEEGKGELQSHSVTE